MQGAAFCRVWTAGAAAAALTPPGAHGEKNQNEQGRGNDEIGHGKYSFSEEVQILLYHST